MNTAASFPIVYQYIYSVEYLNEYQEEMKRRKVVFPGFRPGKLPPYVMGDVRRYLVCFGLETMIGQLCNNNRLEVCFEVITLFCMIKDAFMSTDEI